MRMFTQSDYNALLKLSGSEGDYYESRLCSCVANNNGKPDPTCSCIFGYRYKTPVTAMIQYNSINEYTQIVSQGEIPEGSCNLTFFPTKKVTGQIIQDPVYDLVKRGDIIVFKNQVRPQTQILTKGRQETLYAFGVKKVYSVSWIDQNFEEDTDYELIDVTIDGFTYKQISWINGGTFPPDRERYVVSFSAFEQYICLKPVKQDRGSDLLTLPKKMRFVKRSYEFQLPTSSGFSDVQFSKS